MKPSYFLASKYSEALINILSQKAKINHLENYVKAFREISTIMEENESFKDVIFNPLLPVDFVVNKLVEVSDYEDEIYINFLKTLVQKKRLNLIPLITELLYRKNLELNETIEVKLILAKNVSKKVLNEIKSTLQKNTGKNIKLVVDFEEELIGGMQLYIEDKFFDYSVKGFLDNIQSAYAPTGGGEIFEG
ncbi:MAG TPA: ATP synthase F1 subunit delta [Defluviitoga sp.]|nr:ATP synthase F1 subunit delta [Defluviitoga sp.]HOP25167.1 ATP synthase F1 subunit delta [Defluviitoga sp.]HPZ28367.1 ATP synthase F1 subunit delta [Defluviitoga sp.]HQD62257.1 ATP synthase F1 subunit delta [Defluviitoga sp.]